MAIVTGILIAYAADWALADMGPTNWRWMFGSAAFPAIIFIALLTMVPESPRWLLKVGREATAEQILARVNGATEARRESIAIQESLARESGSLRQLFQPGMRLALIIGIILAILQQVTGINTVIYYARAFLSTLVLAADHPCYNRSSPAWSICSYLVAILIVDKIGRKPLLSFGSLGMGLSLFLMDSRFISNGFPDPGAPSWSCCILAFLP